MLEQAESLDSDEVRNDDGDQVVDPPDRWIDSTDNTSLDDKLAAEVPDAVDAGAEETVPTEAHDSDQGGGLLVVSDSDLDDVDRASGGRDSGQIDGTPEDGESFFDVVK